jgi:LPXTG-site transpeptidase (sortase) family protein
MSGHRKRTRKQARSITRISFTPVYQPAQQSHSKLFLFFDGITKTPLFFTKIRNNFPSFSRSRKIGMLFLFAGMLLVTFPYLTAFFTQVSADQVPIRADEAFTANAKTEELPVRILIPSLEIDLLVTPSKLVNGYWEVSENSASFGLGSAHPGTIGNTVIFAHAKEDLFLPLKNITFGKDIYVLTSYRWYRYKVEEIREVLPADVYVVKKTQDNRLTLFTCTGFLDSKRLVVIAKPVN